MIQQLEELHMNAWPALKTYFYDGWILRFNEGYTKRSNSITPIYTGSLADLEAKIEVCEILYRQQQLKPIFKIILTTTCARELDRRLASRGYEKQDTTWMMTLKRVQPLLQSALYQHRNTPSTHVSVHIEHQVMEEWLQLLVSWGGLNRDHLSTATHMFSQSPCTQGFFIVYEDRIPVACGIGVMQQGILGIYNVVTAPEHRRKGYARVLMLHVLKWGGGAWGKSCIPVSNAK